MIFYSDLKADSEINKLPCWLERKEQTSDFLLALPSSSDPLFSSCLLPAIICSSFSSGLVWARLSSISSSSKASLEWCGASCPAASVLTGVDFPLLLHRWWVSPSRFSWCLWAARFSFSSSSGLLLCTLLFSPDSPPDRKEKQGRRTFVSVRIWPLCLDCQQNRLHSL